MAVIYIHFAIFKYINKHLEFLEAIFLRISKGLLKIHADHIKPVLGNCMMLVLILSNLAIHNLVTYIQVNYNICNKYLFVVHVYNVQSGSRIWLPIYIFNSKLIIFDNPYIWILKFILYNAFTIYENWILYSSTSILYEQTVHKYIKNLVSSKRIIGVLTKILWLFTGNIKAAVTLQQIALSWDVLTGQRCWLYDWI